ncbi:hypothetical protein CKY47_15920 [Saccharothrix yanglingensis]|uniref:Uncharacterized protein n=1 Tax=Saccharothrix yanglingensis TaxID=659496 RepID=A0ABU0X4B2_9PSEU|nr:hypothetical protein [Saccharothrix yanglingensis]
MDGLAAGRRGVRAGFPAGRVHGRPHVDPRQGERQAAAGLGLAVARREGPVDHALGARRPA